MLDVLPQPVVIQNANLYAFILKGDTDKILNQCIKSLNEAADGHIEYYPLSPYILMTMVDLQEIKSGVKPYSELGSIRENELTFFVVLAAGRREGGIFIAERIVLHVPFIFVDNSFAMTAGREIFGFPKQWGWLDFPSHPDNLSSMTVDTDVIQTYAPTAQASRQRLLTIDVGTAHPNPEPVWEEFEDLLRALRDVLFGEGEIIIPGLRLLPNLFEDAIKMQVPLAFLKEFRSIKNGKDAAYQNVVEAPVRVTNMPTDFKRLDFEFNIQIGDYESLPIIETLGLSKASDGFFHPELSFWVQFNMQFENGKVITKPDPVQGCLSLLKSLFT